MNNRGLALDVVHVLMFAPFAVASISRMRHTAIREHG